MGGSIICAIAVIAAAIVAASCGGAARRSDPPTLVLWSKVGDIKLGESPKLVEAEYGRERRFGYRLHGGTVEVESNWPHSGVTSIYVSTRYYRTKGGFGVGSKFPARWHRAFIDNPTLKQNPCRCWVKVGTGRRSLRPSAANFGKPWVIIDVSHGRVTAIYLTSKYVD